MHSTPPPPSEAAVVLPVLLAADLQDSLLVVLHDLNRLEGLISHAAETLMQRFDEAHALLTDDVVGVQPALVAARNALGAAVTELQFHDMASQLIGHTTRVLDHCAFRLAAQAMGEEEGEESAPLADNTLERPNPVTQSVMDAGSVELF